MGTAIFINLFYKKLVMTKTLAAISLLSLAVFAIASGLTDVFIVALLAFLSAALTPSRKRNYE